MIDLKDKTPAELESYFVGVVDELSNFKLELSSDPVASGLESLHVQMQAARKANERAAGALAEATWVKDASRRKVNYLKSLVGIERASLLAHDEEVRSGKDVKTRESLAELKLSGLEVYQDYQDASSVYEVASTAASAIEVFWRSFRDYRDDLNFQLKVVQQRVLIGEIDVVNSEGFDSSEVKSLKVDSELFEAQEGIGNGIGEIDL